MPPLSRPRRRRMLLMNESPVGNEVVEPAQAESPSFTARTAGTMQQQFLDDCGVPEGFDVQISVQGRSEVHSVHIDDAFTFLGRDEECGVRLAGADIGRHHAYLQAVAGQFIVVDLGSRTGIRQNGRAVRTALLSSGEAIELGPYTIRISNDAGSEFHDAATDSLAHRGNPPIALAFVNQSKPIEPWTLDTPVTLIGSAKPCRIRLEHATVTPQHSAIIRGFTRWWIVDLNSQAGTILDDRPVPFAPLKTGSTVRLGRFQIEVQRPKVAESVIQEPIFDEGSVHTPSAVRAPSLIDVVATTQMTEVPAAAPGPQVVNEHLVLELFKEFAALHERTVSQMQQSFREMLEVATSNRAALPAPAVQETAAPVTASQPAPIPVAPPEPIEDVEPTLTDLMHSDDPEERVAAQELLAAQMRSLDAKLRGQREGIAKRLLRSLSLTK